LLGWLAQLCMEHHLPKFLHWYSVIRDVTDSKSESDGSLHFLPKSVGYLKSDRNGFRIFVSVQLYNYFRK